MGLLRRYHPARNRRARPPRRAAAGDRRSAGWRPISSRMIDGAVARTARQRPIDLAIALNYGARDEIAARRAQLVAVARTASSTRRRSTRRRSSAGSTPPSCRRSTCSSAPPASGACPISCCGRRPTPNCCSSTRCGPISTATALAERWPIRRPRAAVRRAMSEATNAAASAAPICALAGGHRMLAVALLALCSAA